MGHSFGGYFTLFAMSRDLTEGAVFDNYIAASPSLWYYNNYLIKQFESLLLHNDLKKPAILYLTVGEMEMEESQKNKLRFFRKELSENDYILLKSKVYKRLGHMGTAIPTFEDGIEHILGK